MKLYQDFRRYLCKEYIGYKVSVQRKNIRVGSNACCYILEDSTFLIEINNTLSEDMAIQMLIHEFAHVLTWNAPEKHHGPIWGVAYAEVYEVWLRYLEIPSSIIV